jgi:hypothetical protein
MSNRIYLPKTKRAKPIKVSQLQLACLLNDLKNGQAFYKNGCVYKIKTGVKTYIFNGKSI